MEVFLRFSILTIMAFLVFTACNETGTQRPNVLLILLDTVRADHVHCYGYERETTPTLDSLAESGIMWRNVQGQASWTLPAMSSIFTGMTERQHLAGIRGDDQYALQQELSTIPELFSEAGYQTAGFYTVPVMGVEYGFDQGMDYCDMEGCTELFPADVMVEKYLYWADFIRNKDTPYFTILHFFDPHYRYEPPSPWNRKWGDVGNRVEQMAASSASGMINAWFSGLISGEDLTGLVKLYDGEICYMDHEISVFLEGMRQRGLLENTVILIIADHGEEFGDHGGVTHGVQPHSEITGIPMIMSGAGIPSGVVREEVVGQIDVLPTLAGIAGLQVPEGVSGIDILSQNAPTSRVLPTSGYYAGINKFITVRRGPYKLFWNTEDYSAFMFNLEVDPGEQDTLPPDSALIEEAAFYWATPGEVTPEPMPHMEGRVEMFRNLGYLR